MTLDGFLTFLTLVVGGLTFMSAVTRLRLQLALGVWAVWCALGFAGVLYFEFFQALAPTCPSWLGDACPMLELKSPPDAASALTPQQMAFLVVLAWGLLTGTGLYRSRVHGWSLPTLARLVVRLVHARDFPLLIDLVDPNLGRLDVFADRRGRLQRLHDALAPDPRNMAAMLKVSLLGETDKTTSEGATKRVASTGTRLRTQRWSAIRDSLASRGAALLSRAVPSGRTAQAAAKDVLRTLMDRNEVIDFIGRERPEVGARLLQLNGARSSRFPARFLAGMIERPGSWLYEEIENSQSRIGCAYDLAADAWILHALLDDARVAHRLDAYRPVAERTLAMLDPINDADYVSSLNTPWHYEFDDSGVWRDPTFVTVRYIDMIARAAACQDVASHMWVYYLDDIVQALELHYDEGGAGIASSAEFPIRSTRIIYEVFTVLVDLVELAARLPEGSVHRRAEDDRVDRGTVIIPKAAAVTLGDAMKVVATSSRIPERIKVYLLEIAMRAFRDNGPIRAPSWVRPTVIASIARGGTSDGGDPYRGALCDLYQRTDHVFWPAQRDFESAIGFPLPSSAGKAVQAVVPVPRMPEPESERRLVRKARELWARLKSKVGA